MVSTLSGPIPSHPYYDKTDPREYLDLPPGRTRPEAAEYAVHGARGTVGMLFEVTGRACSASSTSSLRKSENNVFFALHFNSTEMITLSLGFAHSILVVCTCYRGSLILRSLPWLFLQSLIQRTM